MATTTSPSAGPASRAEATPAAIRDQLERILASPAFRGSPRRRSLLQFLVEEALAGRGDRLKGSTVAIAVFGRGTDFDSQADPVVRLEARRLRRDLDGYYAGAGSRDPVRISVPTGSYRPRFEMSEAEPGPEAPPAAAPPRRRVLRRAALAVVAAAAVLGLAAWSWRHFRPADPDAARGPAVVVLPFEPLGESEADRDLASGLSYELITDLMRFAHFRVYSPRASLGPDRRRRPAGARPRSRGRLRGQGRAALGQRRGAGGGAGLRRGIRARRVERHLRPQPDAR